MVSTMSLTENNVLPLRGITIFLSKANQGQQVKTTKEEYSTRTLGRLFRYALVRYYLSTSSSE